MILHVGTLVSVHTAHLCNVLILQYSGFVSEYSDFTEDND